MFQTDAKTQLRHRSTISKSEQNSSLARTKAELYKVNTSRQQFQKVSNPNLLEQQNLTNEPDEGSATTSSKINQLQDELSAQRQEIKQLTQQNNQLTISQREVRSKNQQQLSSINETRQSNIKAKAELTSIQQQLTIEKAALSLKQQELNKVLENLNETRQLSGQQIIQIENREKELASLKKQLSTTDIQISDLKNRFTVFEMKQEILFNEGEARLNKNGQRAVSILAKILRQFPDRHIAIQGHTDNQALGKKLLDKFTSNWELAAARSASAIHYLQHVEKINPQRMILVSYAQYRPIRSNASVRGQANNRRIEVILMPKDFDFFRETTE